MASAEDSLENEAISMPFRNEVDLAFATRAIHHGYDPAGFSNSVQTTVFLTLTYGFESVAANEAAAAAEDSTHANTTRRLRSSKSGSPISTEPKLGWYSPRGWRPSAR